MTQALDAAEAQRADELALAVARAKEVLRHLEAHGGAAYAQPATGAALTVAHPAVEEAMRDGDRGAFVVYLCVAIPRGQRTFVTRMLCEQSGSGAAARLHLAGCEARPSGLGNWCDIVVREALDAVAKEIRACPPGPIENERGASKIQFGYGYAPT